MTTGSAGNRRRRLFWLRWNASGNTPQNTQSAPSAPAADSAPVKATDPNLSPLVKSLLGYSNLEFDIPQEVTSEPAEQHPLQPVAASLPPTLAPAKTVAEQTPADRPERQKSSSKSQQIREAQDRLKELEVLLRMTSQPDRETCLKLIQDCQFALRNPPRRKTRKLPRQPR